MLIAHRGESFEAPENTLAAINMAWETGSRMVELDVRLTRDGELVLCHDADTMRISGENLAIADHTLERLARLDVGRWKGDCWTGERIATLEQVFKTTPADGKLVIEVKSGVETVGPLVSAIRDSRDIRPDQCIIISFHAQVIAKTKQALPELEAWWLVSPQRLADGGWAPNARQLIDLTHALGAQGVNLAAGPMIDAAFVKALHDAGLKVYVWTVDEPTWAGELLAAGVDGVTTNRPAWVRQQNAKI